MRNAGIYLLLLWLFAGCVKQTDWTMPGGLPDLLVVEATLTDERKSHLVSLTKPADELNATPAPVSGAIILVSSDDSTWTFQEDTNNTGHYLSEIPFSAGINKDYLLQIYSGGKQYSARETMVEGKYFHELSYVKNEDDDWYHIDWVASVFETENPAMWEVLIDWPDVPDYENADPDSCRARLIFYTLPTLDISEIFAPLVEQTSFPAGSIITERRYSLSPGHAEFIRQLLLETTWQGSLFPTANANVITNLSEGAIGYFGVCAVTELSLVVE